jgi:hypothetical protein
MTLTIHVEGLLGRVKAPDQDAEAPRLGTIEDRLELIMKNRLSSNTPRLLEHVLVVLNHAGEVSVLHADDLNVALSNVGRDKLSSRAKDKEGNPLPLSIIASENALGPFEGNFLAVDTVAVDDGTDEGSSGLAAVEDSLLKKLG